MKYTTNNEFFFIFFYFCCILLGSIMCFFFKCSVIMPLKTLEIHVVVFFQSNKKKPAEIKVHERGLIL